MKCTEGDMNLCTENNTKLHSNLLKILWINTEMYRREYEFILKCTEDDMNLHWNVLKFIWIYTEMYLK